MSRASATLDLLKYDLGHELTSVPLICNWRGAISLIQLLPIIPYAKVEHS